MLGFELLDVSARISKELTAWNPAYNKVKTVRHRKMYEMVRTTVPMNSSKFWADDSKHKIVSKEEKERFFLQYHRSIDNHGHVYALAYAIKNLCDHGIPIFHQGVKVVDFFILTNPEFEIDDDSWESSLLLIDPISGRCINNLPTYDNFEVLRNFPAEVCKRLGILPPTTEDRRDKPKLALPSDGSHVMPHMWLAAILEDDHLQHRKIRSMVHVDICAAAYDEQGYVDHNGSLVSLKLFETPEYEITATSNLERAIKYRAFDSPKLLLLPHVRFAGGLWHFGMLNFLANSFRHLRCLQQPNSIYIEVTPLEFFVDHGCHFDDTKMDRWLEFVNNLRLEVIRDIPRGASAFLCGFQQIPELNGKECVIEKDLTNTTMSTKKNRVIVSVSDRDRPISVCAYSLGITKEKMYTTLDIFARKAERDRWMFSMPEDDRVEITKKMMEAVNEVIEENPDVASVIDMLTVGKPSILTYSNLFFKNGLHKLLNRPVCCIVSKPMTQNIQNILQVLSCHKAEEALKILEVIRMGKLKLLEKEPQALLRDGSLADEVGTDFHHLMSSVQNKINSDAGLNEVFDLMGQYNIFPALPWN